MILTTLWCGQNEQLAHMQPMQLELHHTCDAGAFGALLHASDVRTAAVWLCFCWAGPHLMMPLPSSSPPICTQDTSTVQLE